MTTTIYDTNTVQAHIKRYSTLVVDTILHKLEPDYPILKHIHLKIGSHSGSQNIVTVNDEINNIDPVEVGVALTALINRISRLTGEYPFQKEMWFYLNPYEGKLKEMNVELPSPHTFEK